MSSRDSVDPRGRQFLIPAKDERADPPYLLGERALLESLLEWHRETPTVKCAGLDTAQSRGHRDRVARDAQDTHGTVPVRAVPGRRLRDVDAEASVANWRQEVAPAGEPAGARTLEDTGTRPGGPVPPRRIRVHMIEEYGRRNGHADLLRERIDGTTGE